MRKRVLTLFTAFLLLLLISGCKAEDRLSKDAIFRLVEGNQELLLEEIARKDFAGSKELRGIQSIHTQDNGIIDFNCGGAGFGPATSYCGFYYTTDDDIAGLWCAGPPAELVAGAAGWTYREKHGDNTFYAEKITDHFYYYEASF